MSKILKKRFLFLSLFFADEIGAQICLERDPLNHFSTLQSFDRISYRKYPVSLSKDQVRCIIVPAGCDEQAKLLTAATYRNLQDQTFDKIILLCPSDVLSFHGVALPFSRFDGFFDELNFLENVGFKFAQCHLFHYYHAPFCVNCAMRQQLEFIRFYFQGASVLPMIVGDVSLQEALDVAMVVADNATEKTLIIMSSHIGQYKHCIQECLSDTSKICMIYDQDGPIIQMLQADPVLYAIDGSHDQLPSSILTIFCQLLRLPHFANIQSLFVGYQAGLYDIEVMENIITHGAFIFQNNAFGYKNNIGYYEKLQLLQCARKGLSELFNDPSCRLPCMMSYQMMQPYGLFASLYRMSDHGPVLQGCMGKVQSKQPLYKMAYYMVQQAACKDIRFYPLRHKDLESTIVSLSIICDVKKVVNYDEICQSDGLMLKYDDKKAICLPETMPMFNWNYELALIDLSRQIGNNPFIWRKPRAKLFKFNSILFQEE